MVSVVFLHGALLGGWVWQGVREYFDNEKYKLFFPDLPGRSLNEAKDITLKDHVSSIEEMINSIEHPVIIVAHSMSGIVAAELAEKLGPRIMKIIFVSAYIPLSGESLQTIYEKNFGPLDYDKETMSIRMGKQLTSEDLVKASFDDCSEEMKQMVRENAVSEPIRPTLEKLSLTNEKFGAVPKSYIKLTKDKVIPLKLQVEMINRVNIQEVYEMDTHHAPFCAVPKAFSDLVKKAISV